MFCNKCGNNLSLGAKFCPKCGNLIGEKKEKSSLLKGINRIKKKTIFICMGGLLAVILMVFLVKSLGGDAGRQSIQSIMKKVVSDGEVTEEEKISVAKNLRRIEDIEEAEKMLPVTEHGIVKQPNFPYEVANFWRETSSFYEYFSTNEVWKDVDGLCEVLANEFDMELASEGCFVDRSNEIWFDMDGMNQISWWPESKNTILFTLPYGYYLDEAEDAVKISAGFESDGSDIILTVNKKQYRLKGADSEIQAAEDAQFRNVAKGTWEKNDALVRLIQNNLGAWRDSSGKGYCFQVAILGTTSCSGFHYVTEKCGLVGSVNYEQKDINTVVFSNGSKSLEATYKVEGNVLTLTIDGVDYSMRSRENPIYNNSYSNNW